MNANDARIVRVFTAQVDGTVEDNTPNANAAVPDQFDLILQAEVGGVLGNSGANYTLTFTAINDDMVTRQVSLNPPGNPFKEEWNLGCGWVRSGNDFVKTGPGEADGIMRYRIAIPRPDRRLPLQHPPGLGELSGHLVRPEQPVPARVTHSGDAPVGARRSWVSTAQDAHEEGTPPMGAPLQHEMIHQGTDASGMEEWRCPECGRHFVVRWPPDFERLVLTEGDGNAVHIGRKGSSGLTGIQITPAAGGEDEWRRWLRDNGIDWDGQVG